MLGRPNSDIKWVAWTSASESYYLFSTTAFRILRYPLTDKKFKTKTLEGVGRGENMGKAGKPSGTGKPSGKGRDNNPPRK
jgi:hypothetical protein